MLTDRKITTYQDNIKDLSDTPSSDGVAAETLKNIFDGRTDKEIKGSINGIVDDLTSITDGSSGADNIGATALKESGATTVQGQLEELNNEKVSVIGLASSTDGSSGADSVGSTPLKEGGSSTVQGQLEELSNGKVDKVTGKELSANDFTNAYRAKLDGIEENANNYVLPIASAVVVGGVKAGVSIEILPDGTINGLSAPAPDYPARESIAQEIIDRQNADQALSDRIDTEESTRAGVDTNLQTQITANKNAVNVNISETARTLYGLSAGDANVDKALQKTMQGGLLNSLLTGFNNNGIKGSIVPSDSLATALYKLNNGIESIQIVNGQYTGDGTDTRQINIGMSPDFAFVFQQGKLSSSNFCFKFKQISFSVGGTRTNTSTTFICNDNGFIAGDSDFSNDQYNSTNHNNYLYGYVAVRLK